ncbi:Xenobiotic-transporting ATPase [Candidatus Sulfotelmatomonas gaucii]|uniref:Xenobiotic-transporting ATPase n=1 Tax=Candidatus Sulfuritelmatomonas gaucii TaxID=2043161 RepID=A0A2N9LMM6_9BACT|nr:Xenobiotic-transporting ATPase [Candidatus Sulfotelmatomonas gaucii]
MADTAEKQASQSGTPQARRKADDEVAGKVYDARLMRRLGRYVRPYWLQAGVSSLAVSLKSLCDVAGPILVMVAVDRYLAPASTDNDASNFVAHWLANSSPLAHLLPAAAVPGVTRLAEIYLVLLVTAYALQFIQVYLMQWTGQKIMFDLRRDIFRHMQRMHVGFFDIHPVGRLVTRLTSDVDAVNDMFTDGVLAIVNDAFMLTIMAAVMIAISWWLALLAFSVLPLILFVTRIFRDHVRESYRRVRTAIARINSFTQEHISGMSVVQLFNREDRAFKDFEAVNRQHMVAFIDTIFAYALYYPAVDFLSSVAIALVVWRGGFGVLHLPPTVTIGVLIMFTQFSLRFWRPIQDLSDKYNILQAAMAACERIFKLMDSAPEIVSPAHPVAGDGSNRIEFKHVWFTYQPLTDAQKEAVAKVVRSTADGAALAALDGIEWILKDVSFTIEPGQTVAIVGHTGAGKTTLTSLLMRFYEVTAGRILLDGIDLREHDLTALRQHFAVVLQDPFLFSGTIAENIRFGNDRITEKTMRRAARDVNVLDFVESLPHGFDEPVRERGSSLSTGQKQLINFARALAYNPHILILDEATSSVDTDTELRIRGALERMVEGRTSVLIAHRLSTVQRADTILVMHKGQLREKGSHQELLAQRGLYWKLYQLQYKDQETGFLAPPSAEPSTAPAI